MKLKEPYYSKIQSGEKIYEIRLNDEKRQVMSVGDVIVFRKEPELLETVQTEILDLIHFKSFEELVNSLALNDIGFDGYDKDNVIDVYHSIYSAEQENKYGVLAIKLKVID